jgi:FKBP-type peptidyl-prolyl cis-trans isomerase (trigger factor)
MTNTNKSYTKADIKKLPKSQIEISGSVDYDIWSKNRPQAIKEINNNLTLSGFRKGMVPEEILVSKVGENRILEETAEIALSKAYFDIIVDNKLDCIGKPLVNITKIAKDNPLEFKITSTVVPEVKLPNCKEIVKAELAKVKKEDNTVTDKDLEDAINKIRKAHASKTKDEKGESIETLPELTDEFVKKLGDFNDVPDFKTKLSAMIAEEKIMAEKEKTRIRIADCLNDAVSVEIPDIMIESELNRTQAQFEADIERMNVKLDDYLKHAKKTLEEIRTEWRPYAEKKAKLQLILNEISKTEKIFATPDEVKHETDHILEHYKDADRERATVYAETVLTNEKVFEWLES